MKIAISLIEPNGDQPRKTFPQEHIFSLADSIREKGLVQPILVRPLADGRFEIVAGECRWRAHKLLAAGRDGARFSEIEATVRDMDVRERDVVAIVENMQRQDVSPLEEARALRRLFDQGMTIPELATATGAAAYKIEWRLSLFRLSPEILTLFEGGGITLQQAQELARLPNEPDQRRMLQRINRGEITGHRTLHNAIDAILDGMTAVDLFGDAAPRVTDEDVAVMRGMEARIDGVANALSKGWVSGECVIAAKVSPDRARIVAEKLKAIRLMVTRMESDLRQHVSQVQVVMETEAA